MEIKEQIIQYLNSKEYYPQKFKDLALVLNIEEELLGKALDELCFEHIIIKAPDGKYFDAEKNGYYFGIYSYSGKGYGFLRCEKGDDIFIPPDKGKNALNGDKVIVKLLNISSGISREGEVYKVEERVNKTVVGTVQINKNIVFVVPDDRKLSTDIFITNKGAGKYKNNMKVVVRIKKWPQEGKNATGDIVEVLGFAGENEAEVMSVIRENNIRYSFSKNILEDTKKLKVTEKDYIDRTDFRDKTIITIDGEDAKDLDDAVGIERIDNGYRLYVHIADVSNFVKEGTGLDKEALLRGTSVYFADRVIPMLPPEISNGICSLNPNEDKLTLSVVMDINNEGKVFDFKITEGVIKTTRRMTYTNVSKILDDENFGKAEFSDIYNDILLMAELSDILTKNREKRGYINFNFPESKFIFDENKNIVDIVPREFTKANLIIEEFMLLCNETVAGFAFWTELPFIYRIHEKPDEEKLEAFKKILNLQGYTLKNSGKIYPSMFNSVLKEIKDKPEEKVINTMLLRAMMKAKYSPNNAGHFGLALENYCHFTSPIRRYPDLAIHRILKKYLKSGFNENDIKKYISFVEEASLLSSDAEIRAQSAERKIEDIKKAEFMEKYIGSEFEGIISSVTSFGMFVEFENTVEGLIRYADIKGDYYEFNKELMCAMGERKGKIFKIGDRVKTIISQVDKREGEIRLHLA